jgi:hypothetical protein
MSVTPLQLKLLQALTMATSLTTANVGGGVSTVEILATVIGEVLFTMSALPEGEGDLTQYNKAFYKNTNTTDDLTDAKIWLPNALSDGPVGNYPNSAQSSSADDGSAKKVRWLGYDALGDPVQSEKILNGTTLVTDTVDMSEVHGAELRSVATGALVAAAGTITLRRNGETYGVIPPGYSSANSEVAIGLAASLNDTATTTNATTAPSGITFSRPRTFETGLAVAGDDLTSEDSQGIWFRWVQAERRKPSADMQCVVGIRGASA